MLSKNPVNRDVSAMLKGSHSRMAHHIRGDYRYQQMGNYHEQGTNIPYTDQEEAFIRFVASKPPHKFSTVNVFRLALEFLQEKQDGSH